jgi:thiol-disulfide isomerase/thioredoxin
MNRDTLRRCAAVLVLCLWAFHPSYAGDETMHPPAPSLRNALERPYAAPEFSGIETWINAEPLTLSALRGKVVLVDFWTYSCINCIRTLPYITRWDKEYRKHGLVIVGVHAPEFDFEKDRANVENAIATHAIRYPVALDNGFTTWRNYQNRYWPAHYLINTHGEVVYTHFGEGEYKAMEGNIRALLGLAPLEESASSSETGSGRGEQTPETYLGYVRAEHNANRGGLREGAAAAYRFPDALSLHSWALHGACSVSVCRYGFVERGKGPLAAEIQESRFRVGWESS